MLILRAFTVAAVVLALSACASKGSRDGVDARPTGPQPIPGAPPATRPITDFGGDQGRSLSTPSDGQSEMAARLADNVVYFDFDTADLSSDGLRVVQAYGDFLASSPSARVRLEGHTDERGTREYNVGLGERRAVSVEQALLRAGATPSQINTLSYGEERPTCLERDESCWSRNRRVEIIRL